MADEKHQEKVCLRNVRPEESQSSTSERALMKMVVKEIPPRELQSKELQLRVSAIREGHVVGKAYLKKKLNSTNHQENLCKNLDGHDF